MDKENKLFDVLLKVSDLQIDVDTAQKRILRLFIDNKPKHKNMENIGKKLVEKFCKHQGYGNYSVDETKLIEAINEALDKAREKGAVKAQKVIEALQNLKTVIEKQK